MLNLPDDDFSFCYEAKITKSSNLNAGELVILFPISSFHPVLDIFTIIAIGSDVFEIKIDPLP